MNGPEASRAADKGAGVASRELLLLVDDDDTLGRVLERALGRLGFTVCRASSVAEGLALGGRLALSHAVLDLKLGDGSGLLLVSALRARHPQARILMLTGYASIATAVEAIKLGADDYLAKPVDGAQRGRSAGRRRTDERASPGVGAHPARVARCRRQRERGGARAGTASSHAAAQTRQAAQSAGALSRASRPACGCAQRPRALAG